MNKIVLFLFFSIVSFSLFSQSKSEIIQQRIELISEQLETEELDLTNLVEQLNYYFDNPINLNNTTFEELDELELLTDVQINLRITIIKILGLRNNRNGLAFCAN
jgi:hypothetical protein